MIRHGRASAVVSVLLALILGVAGTSNADAPGEPIGSEIGSTRIADVLGASSSPGSLEVVSRSVAGGLDGIAHPGPAGGLEPEPISECELDDDPSSAAVPAWIDVSGREGSQRVWSREESGAHPIQPGANRSRAPPHA